MDDAEQFFYERAGYSYDPTTQTQDEGRRETAHLLAVAERWAKREGVRFEWMDDWTIGVPHAEFFSAEAYPDGDPQTCEALLVLNDQDKVLASLGCIDDADADYRRVVEAELSLEAWQLQTAWSERGC